MPGTRGEAGCPTAGGDCLTLNRRIQRRPLLRRWRPVAGQLRRAQDQSGRCAAGSRKCRTAWNVIMLLL